MTGWALPVVVGLPLLLAVAPAMLPARATTTSVATAGLLAALLTLAITLWSFRMGPISAGPWRNDAGSRTLSLLVALAWTLTASQMRSRSADVASAPASRWNRWPVAAQLAAAGAMAICRADPLILLPPCFAILLSATGRLRGESWRDAAQSLAPAIAIAFGALVLSGWLGVPATWTLLRHDAMPPVAVIGLVLVVAPALLLAVAATLRCSDDCRHDAASCLAPALSMLPATALLLHAGVRLAPVAILVGLAWIALSLALMPARRALSQRIVLSASTQFGAALLGLGAGGPGGVAAALMLTGFSCLLLPIMLRPAPPPLLRRLCILVAIGLPPFAPFAAGLVLLLRLFAFSPTLALTTLAAFALAAAGVSSASRENEPAARRPSTMREVVRLVPAMLILVLAAWFGLAMPGAVSGWLLALSEARP